MEGFALRLTADVAGGGVLTSDDVDEGSSISGDVGGVSANDVVGVMGYDVATIRDLTADFGGSTVGRRNGGNGAAVSLAGKNG